ncbi:MAG: hypothetical protein IJV85_03550 [Clostridia bacterium]|nr:hypothetical protein [Clostridia bacterium]
MPEFEDKYIKPKRAKRKPSTLGGKILALILGLFLGIIVSFGGVFGLGYYFIVQSKLKDTINLFNGLTGSSLNANDIFAEQYAENNVLYLVNGITLASQEIMTGKGSLNTLNAISPMVGLSICGDDSKNFGGLVDSLKEMGMKITEEEVMHAPFVYTEGSTQPNLSALLVNAFYDMEMGTFLKNNGKEPKGLMLILCYGIEGEDYHYEGDKVVMEEGKTATTIRMLIDGDLEELIFRVPLDAVMKPDPNDSLKSALMYGKKNVHYKIVNGKAEMQQQRFTLQDNVFYDVDGNAVNGAVTDLGGSKYKLVETDEETKETTVTYLSLSESGDYLAYQDETLQTPKKYKKTTVGDLEDDQMAIINNIYLKDALEIDHTETNRVLISLAYGTEGTDFNYVYDSNGKVVGIDEINEPRTIGDLRERGSTLIDDILLTDIMEEDRDNAVVMYLLYGKKDVHYEIDPTTGKVEMLQKRIAIYNNKPYNEYGEPLNGVLDTLQMTYTETQTDREGNTFTVTYEISDPVMDGDVQSTVKTVKDGDGNSYAAPLYYLTLDGEPVNYKATSLGDLTGDNPLIDNLTDRLTLVEVLDEETLSGNKFLSHIKNERISDLPEAVDNLTVGQIFDKEMYYVVYEGEPYTDSKGNPVSSGDYVDYLGVLFKKKYTGSGYTDANGHLVTSGCYVTLKDPTNLESPQNTLFMYFYEGESFTDSAGHPVTNGDMVDSTAHLYVNYDKETGKIIQGTWKYMLSETVGGVAHVRTDYKIASDMTKLMDNMQNNMHEASMRELYDDGIVNFSESTLDKKIRYDVGGVQVIDPAQYDNKEYLGDLRIGEMIEYLDTLLNYI